MLAAYFRRQRSVLIGWQYDVVSNEIRDTIVGHETEKSRQFLKAFELITAEWTFRIGDLDEDVWSSTCSYDLRRSAGMT
jgi:hypothetical protein